MWCQHDSAIRINALHTSEQTHRPDPCPPREYYGLAGAIGRILSLRQLLPNGAPSWPRTSSGETLILRSSGLGPPLVPPSLFDHNEGITND